MIEGPLLISLLMALIRRQEGCCCQIDRSMLSSPADLNLPWLWVSADRQREGVAGFIDFVERQGGSSDCLIATDGQISPDLKNNVVAGFHGRS
ncbi:hypothetical protein ACLOJK_041762 [Asimina triloba]